MPDVKAPYNFVPLNEKVFFPDWADLVSHDIPFKNGLSGKIELEITAETPIFIRKPYEEGDEFYLNKDDKKIAKEFCHIKEKNENGNVIKKYYIPGSSIRNMLRSVVEIMGFGKLGFFNKPDRFSFRDMANPHLYNVVKDANNLKMGWLVKDANNNKKILNVGDLGSLRNRHNPNTIYRPNNYNDRNKNINFSKLERNAYSKFINPKTSLAKKYKIYHNSENDYQHGYKESAATLNRYDNPRNDKVVVITGNINGKRNEFLFPKPRKAKRTYSLEQSVFDDFIVANTTNVEDKNNWNFWKKKFDKNEPVPIFFRVKNSKVIDFGLTVLYKMAYQNKLEKIIQNNQPDVFSTKKDLAEIIFGYINENDDSNNDKKLKGRIRVSHSFSENAQISEEVELILGEPKFSFYPNYIKQDVGNDAKLRLINPTTSVNYKTLNDDDAEISGRKRYPVHYNFQEDPSVINPDMNNQNDNNNENDKVRTKIIPLKPNAVFKTTIYYHNLLSVELGALLSAITFHNSSECRHNIGLAKPYGYGRIKIDIKNITANDELITDNTLDYMGLFEKTMNEFDNEWLESEQIRELTSMAHLFPNQDVSKLKYMRLQDFQRIKTERREHVDSAKQRLNKDRVSKNERLITKIPEALPLYSKFMNHTYVPNPIPTNLQLDDDLRLNDRFINFKTEATKNIQKLIDEINDKIHNNTKKRNS